MKTIKRFVCAFLAVLMVVLMLPAATTQAATGGSSHAALAYNGKWTYYAVDNTIYKLNSEEGTTKKVVTLNRIKSVSDISYYDGYIYFTGDYSSKDKKGENKFVCRVKTDGKGFTKLARGKVPVIMDKKIYYFKTKHSSGKEDKILGIAEMTLNGKNVKTLVKNSSEDSMTGELTATCGNICYIKTSEASKPVRVGYDVFKPTEYYVVCYDIKKKSSMNACISRPAISLAGSDDTYVYFASSNGSYENFIYAFNVKACALSTQKRTTKGAILGSNNRVVYYASSSGGTYGYSFKKKQFVTLAKDKSFTSLTFSKSGYNIATYESSQEGTNAADSKANPITACIKTSGKGFKVLHK